MTDSAEVDIPISVVEPVAEPGDVLAAGSSVGDFALVAVLGQGGCGTVYSARHRELGTEAAIKVIHRRLATDVNLVQRFLDEARLVNTIAHPALVDIFAVGSLPDGRPYLVMELLQGSTLTVCLKQQQLTLAERLSTAEQCCIALRAAHAKGVVHRDLKPDNIFIQRLEESVRIKLLDFGVAKLIDQPAGSELTRTGIVLGTPSYMSPEQLRGQPVTPASDVYALGVIFYRLFTGSPPFVGQSTADLVVAHLRQSPRTLSNEVPPRLAPVLPQMLAKNAAARPSLEFVQATIAASLAPTGPVATALDAAAARIQRPEPPPPRISSPTPTPAPVPVPVPVEEPPTEKRRLPVVGLAALALAGFGATLFGLRHQHPTLRPTTGVVTIRSTPPGATVTIDGVASRWTTPVVADDLPLGHHTVDLALPDWLPARAEVSLAEPARSATVDVALRRAQAQLVVTCTPTSPNLRATLDGEPLSLSHPQPMSAGDEHHLMVTAPGYSTQERTVASDAGELVHIDVVLTPTDPP